MGRITKKTEYLLILLVGTFLCLILTYICKVSIGQSIIIIPILWLLPLSILLEKYMLEREITLIAENLKKQSEDVEKATYKIQDIKQEKAYLEKKLADLSGLYSITKDMSFNLRFGELLESLKNFLEDNFSFGRLSIILFEQDENDKVTKKIYEIGVKSDDKAENKRAIEDFINNVIKMESFIFLDKKDGMHNFGFAKDTENVLGIPLIIRQKIISIILVENLKKDDCEKFLILAPQIALQIDRIGLFDSVEKISITDGLTGAYLRRYFVKRLKEEITRSEQCKMNLSFIMLDLDKFKECNDNFGHLVGDVVLKDVSNIITKNIREIDLVARYGGEEFCILLPEADKTGAHAVGERIRKSIEKHVIKAYDESTQITVSMGISSFPEDSKDVEGLIEAADKALYEAKREGRNIIHIS